MTMNVISCYVRSTSLLVPTVVPTLRKYSQDAYTDSKLNEEFIPNTQVQSYIPDINFSVVSSGGSTTPVPSESAPQVPMEAHVLKPQVPQPKFPPS